MYGTARSYNAVVTVIDRDGGSASRTQSITVAAANTAPVVRADMGVAGLEAIGFQSGVVLLTGSYTDTQNNGPFRVSVQWTPGGVFSPLAAAVANGQFAAPWAYSGTAARVATVRICDAANVCGTDTISIRPNVSSKVTPIVQCVVDRGANPAGRYVARWSYNNTATVALAIPVVANVENTFTTSPARRGQPEIFLTGRRNNVFTTSFNSGTQAWRLNGTTATARTSSTRC